MQHKILIPEYVNGKLVPQPHSVDTMKFLKKTTTTTTWQQPILSANGTLGGNIFAVYASSVYDSNRVIYKAFNGVNDTLNSSSNELYETSTNWNGATIIMYNPTPIRITKLQIDNKVNWGQGTLTAYNLYGSNDNSSYTLIGNYSQTSSQSWVQNISNNNFYKYYKLEMTGKSSSGSYITITEIYITATEQTETWSAGTSSNYTLKKPQCHSVIVPRYLKKTGTQTAWTQPILSANGTLGGSSFAVVDAANSSYDLWKGFDGSDSTYGICGVGTSTFIFYNPTPLKISQFTYKFGAYGKNWAIYGSDDNSSWTQITVSQSPNSTEGTVILSGDSGYKYHKIVFQQGATYGLMVYFINITATIGTETWSAGTSSNYTIIK